jgi:hypothetical protein
VEDIQKLSQWPGSSAAQVPTRSAEAFETTPGSILACMPLAFHLLSKNKNHLPAGANGSLFETVFVEVQIISS